MLEGRLTAGFRNRATRIGRRNGGGRGARTAGGGWRSCGGSRRGRHLLEVAAEHDDHRRATRSRVERDELAGTTKIRENELGLGLVARPVPDLRHLVVGAVGVGG